MAMRQMCKTLNMADDVATLEKFISNVFAVFESIQQSEENL